MESLRIELVYALPDAQYVSSLNLAPGATVADAIAASAISAEHPEIDLARQPVGIFGRRVRLDQRLAQGDRVEIYRGLVADPKTSRRRRAEKRRR
jgi:uncharacterized protein